MTAFPTQAFPDHPAPPASAPSPLTVDDLLARMRTDDREAAAIFITRYGSRIRRRIRGKLSPAMRRVFDSQDILSTVGRRLDQVVRKGRLQAVSEAQLWALVFRIARRAVVDKARVFQRLKRAEGEDGPLALALLDRLHSAGNEDRQADELEQALRAVDDGLDREILSLWLNDVSHTVIADQVGIAPTAVRKRWQRIRAILQKRLREPSP